MFFSRTYKYHSAASAHDIKNRLLGNHVKVHDLDFEVTEKEQTLKIVPTTGQFTDIQTLPVTHVKLKNKGRKTQILIKAKMRPPDAGGRYW